MKVTPKQYAISLYEVVQDRKDSEIKAALENFLKLVIKNNDISQVDKIIDSFSRIWNEEGKLVEAEIFSANEPDEQTIKLIKEYIKKISGAKEVISKTKIDNGVIGGVKVRYGDKIIDGSLKTRIGELKSKMIK